MSSRITIVGNAPSALDFEIGHLIDASDQIVRINNYEMSDAWSAQIGTRTTIYASNLYQRDLVKTLPQLLQDGVEEVWPTIPKCHMLRTWRNDWDAAEKTYAGRLAAPIDLKSFITLTSNLSGSRARTICFLIERFGFWAYLLIQNNIVMPSSGLVAIYLAIQQAPKEILITGFDFFSQARKHYFSDAPPPNSTHHQFAREPDVLADLIRLNRQTEFRLAVSDEIFNTHFSRLDNASQVFSAT